MKCESFRMTDEEVMMVCNLSVPSFVGFHAESDHIGLKIGIPLTTAALEMTTLGILVNIRK